MLQSNLYLTDSHHRCLSRLDCLLGPAGDEEKNTDRNPQHNIGFRHPPHPFSHNAFHVWDQDDVVIPMSPEDSPQTSPLLLAAIPYIPSFIPHPHSPLGHSPLGSPGPIRGLTLPGDFWVWWLCVDTQDEAWNGWFSDILNDSSWFLKIYDFRQRCKYIRTEYIHSIYVFSVTLKCCPSFSSF